MEFFSPILRPSQNVGPTYSLVTRANDDRFALSQFGRNSYSDVALQGLEEKIARLTVNDNFTGPSLLVDEPGRPRQDQVAENSWSASSLALVPPGVLMASEVWDVFAQVEMPICNGIIDGMDRDTLRRCLHAHNLNQRGSRLILRKRLREFVRRLRTPGGEYVGPSVGTVDGDRLHFPRLNGTPAGTTSRVANRTEFPMMKLHQPTFLTPDAHYDYLLIIDLEASCQDEIGAESGFIPEIIEFPVILYDTRRRKCVGIFHKYCKPLKNPRLSAFCQSLTGIRQDVINNAVDFPTVLNELEIWIYATHCLHEKRFAVVCDSYADMAKFMKAQCNFSNMEMPNWALEWINISTIFHSFYRLPRERRSHLKTMLQDLGLSLAGQHHNGLHDALNILRVVQIMLADGCRLRVNQRFDSSRPLNYTSFVPNE